MEIKSNPVFKILVIVLVIILGVWFWVENRNNQEEVSGTPSRKQMKVEPSGNFSASDKGEGAVMMTVEYIKEQSDQQKIALRISLDTHSVDLSSVNFAKDIMIEKDGKVYNAISSFDESSEHHRLSVLVFPRVEFPFKVVGQKIGGVERREILMEIKTP